MGSLIIGGNQCLGKVQGKLTGIGGHVGFK
jgi:hypothetical protein